MKLDSKDYSLDFECMTPFSQSECTNKLFINYDNFLRTNVIYKLVESSNAQNESSIHLKLKHRHITKAFWCRKMSDFTVICMKFYCCLNLQDLIDSKEIIENENKLKILKQLSIAIEYLHRNNIVHRDIKPSNILIDENLNIKLCDFGFAKEITNKELLNDFCGSVYSAPPEIIQHRSYMMEKKQTYGA